MNASLVRAVAVSAALALLPAAVPTLLAAQQPAIIAGKVTDASSGAPLAGATVTVPALGLRAATGQDGRYRLEVPAARFRPGLQVTVYAAVIGYASGSKTVVLAPGEVALDFALAAGVLELDALVVPATPGEMRRREVGNAAAIRIRGSSVAADAAGWPGAPGGFNTEAYAAIDENPFLSPARDPLSTFSIDVDAASYSNVRRFLRQGELPPKDAVRIEELVNYFSYDYPDPAGGRPFALVTEVGEAPWAPGHRLVHVGLQGRRIATEDLPPSNLVFLVDVSGSMQPPNKLPLVKQSLRLLVEQLTARDRVAMVVYAGAAGLVLEPTPGDRKDQIMDAIGRLEAGGSTAGGEGLRLAYDVARRHHQPGGNNRVILATDGDFNVGASSDAEMFRLIEERRGEGTFLTVLGFGMGNLKDSKLEGIADRGNGNYAYIDDVAEARKVLVAEMGGTLHTLARDVKLQVEFNPARVAAYRLIGYENRMLRSQDFEDDAKDAGELGAGHSVTALYEVVPVGADSRVRVFADGELRYQRVEPRLGRRRSPELLHVKLRYKEPEGGASRLMEQAVRDPGREAATSADFRFAAAVAGFGMLLRQSEHRGAASVDGVLALARGALGDDAEGYRGEFVRMVEGYGQLAARVAQAPPPARR